MKLFLVYETDGYSRGKLLAAFSLRGDAEMLVKHLGGYAMVEDLDCVLYNSWEDFTQNSDHFKRQRALEKLTAEERRLLRL